MSPQTGRLGLGKGGGRGSWIALSTSYCAALVLVLIWLGPTVIVMAPWDHFVLLDGGWRIQVGQVPHSDFYNPIGPLAYMLVAMGMALVGPNLASISVGNIIFLVVAFSWTAVVAFQRLSPILAAILSVFVATLLSGTRALGWASDTVSYAMIYNRYGWVLLSILLVYLFGTTSRASFRPQSRSSAIAVGVLLGLLFLCKVNFFGVACGGVILALATRYLAASSVWFILLGTGSVCLAAWSLIGFNPLHYLEDVRLAALAYAATNRLTLLGRSLDANMGNIAALLAAWALLIAPLWRVGSGWQLDQLRVTVIAVSLVLAGIVLSSGNTGEGTDIPMFGVVGLLLLDRKTWVWGASTVAVGDGGVDWRRIVATLLVCSSIVGIFAKDLQSIAYSIQWRSYRVDALPASQQFQSARLKDFAIPQDTGWKTGIWYSREIPPVVNEGLTLLRRNVGSSGSLLVLAFGDPFSFALGWHPPRGVPLWWDYGLSYNMVNHPAAHVIFANVTHVIIPIVKDSDAGCCKRIAYTLREIYGPHIVDHYYEIDRTAHWILMGLRPVGLMQELPSEGTVSALGDPATEDDR